MRVLYIFLLLAYSNFCLAQIAGCTDPQSLNFNPLATLNDGSCIYPQTTVSAASSQILPSAISESSGLIAWNGALLTHNDSNDNTLYKIDNITAGILESYTIPGPPIADWEEIAQDQDYLYLGDFGNNVNGNRTDLKILRILKESVDSDPEIDTIHFTYSNQANFLPTQSNATNFDCEAFIVTGDHIYLFTKQWLSNGTSLYKLPKLPGSHVAEFIENVSIGGLITGATQVVDKKIVALSGYDSFMKPFIYLLYGFEGENFFSGNKRRIRIANQFHQIEGISTIDGIHYHLTNERLVLPPYLTIAPKLHTIDLSSYLGNYTATELSVTESESRKTVVLFDRVHRELSIHLGGDAPSDFSLFNIQGIAVRRGQLKDKNPKIDVNGLMAGVYFLRLGTYHFAKSVVID